MQASDVPVLAILVATNGEEWLPEVIRALAEQSHHRLDVIAVDNACTDSSVRLLKKAFGGNAITLERRVGYGRACAAALKIATERETDAEAILLVHDDAVIDREALSAMVEVMFSDEEIGIVGGKLVDWDDPMRLQEIGMATDRYGRIFPTLERGELDQGQHDGTREVLFCTSAMLLVRRTVVERIGLFDPRYVALRDDLDLCWRARLSGFKVVVTSDARARHAAASINGRRDAPVSGATRYFSERNLIATLIKNTSATRLAIVLPMVIAQGLATALLQVLRGRRRIARQIVAALQWNIVHLPSTLRARARGRRHRVATDADVARFMVRGAPRLRGYVERVIESAFGEPVRGIEETEIGGPPPEEEVSHERFAFVRAHPVAAVLAALAVVYLVGARSLFGSGGIAGQGLLPFPEGSTAFFSEFGSGWRSAGVAGAHPPGAAMLLLGVLSVLSLGSTWLAARVLLLILLPVAGGGASRLAGAFGLSGTGRLTAGLAYTISPLALSSFGDGRLPELVLLAAAPSLLLPLLRAAGLVEPAEGGSWRSVTAGVAGLAVAGALAPWALPFVAGAGVAVAITAFATRAPNPVGALKTGAIMTGGAFAMLLPWSVELLREGSPLGIGGSMAPAGMVDLLRLAPGRSPVGHLAWAFPAGAALGIGLALRRRPKQVEALALLASFALLAAWGAGRVSFVAPRPSLPLVAVGAVFAVLAGLGVETIAPALSARSFGLTHLAVAGAAGFLLAGLLAGAGWFAAGDFAGLHRAGALTPSFLEADAATVGDYRLLWIGGLQGRARGGSTDVAVDLTGPAGETMLSYGVRREGPGERYLIGATAAILGGQADQGGRLLAPLGVRQIIARPDAPPGAIAALERQTDLRFRQRFHGARVFDNVAWLPVAAPAVGGGWARASRQPDPFGAVLSVDPVRDPPRGLDRRGPARFSGPVDPSADVLILAQPFDRRWRLFVQGKAVQPRRAFGFATAFDLPPPGRAQPTASPSPRATATKTAAGPRATVSPRATTTPAPVVAGPDARIVWRGQGQTRILLLLQAGLWVVFAAWWPGRAATERGER